MVEEEEQLRDTPRAAGLVHLRDIFAPKRLPYDSSRASDRSGTEGVDIGRGAAQLHRLDRLQEVANLALEDRVGGEEEEEEAAWGCADIGTDHGLLAICLHANGANAIAGDRAAGPLDVAKENTRSYLQHVRDAMGVAPTTRSSSNRSAGELFFVETERQGVRANGVGVPSLECRLGDGLAVLEKGEVDTVCIAGVGVKTMTQILSANHLGTATVACPGPPEKRESTLALLGVRRLVLQPMDARLEYIRNLRVWLRENGWRITQETIVSTPGKGGKHAFLTLRADLPKGADDEDSRPSASIEWPGGHAELSDWLGDFLPARAIDAGRITDGRRERGRREEALTYLAYLQHQRDWLRAIERARSPKAGEASERPVTVGVNRAVVAVQVAVDEARESALDLR